MVYWSNATNNEGKQHRRQYGHPLLSTGTFQARFEQPPPPQSLSDFPSVLPSEDVGVVGGDVVKDGHGEAELDGPRQVFLDARQTLVAGHQAPSDPTGKTDLVMSCHVVSCHVMSCHTMP